MTDRIPPEEMRAAQLRFERKLGEMLMMALAHSGELIETVEARLGFETDFREFLVKLADGETGAGKELVEIAYAMGFEVQLHLSEIFRQPELPQENPDD